MAWPLSWLVRALFAQLLQVELRRSRLPVEVLEERVACELFTDDECGEARSHRRAVGHTLFQLIFDVLEEVRRRAGDWLILPPLLWNPCSTKYGATLYRICRVFRVTRLELLKL